MKLWFVFIQVLSLCFGFFPSFATHEEVLQDFSRPHAQRALVYKLTCLKSSTSVDPSLEEEINELVSVPITLENDDSYIRLNEKLEGIARVRGVGWPRLPQTPFDAETFRAKVLERLPDGTQEHAIDGASTIQLLYEDVRNPASAFAVIRKCPWEVKIYELTQMLGLNVIVPTVNLDDDSGCTAAVFQRPLDWSLIPHLPMRHLLFVDLFAELNGSCTLLRVGLVQRDKADIFKKYHPYFLENISKENIDQLWLYWVVFRPYDATLRNTMVTISARGKFEFKFIDLTSMTRDPYLPEVLAKSSRIAEVMKPFCPETIKLLYRWRSIDPKMFNIVPLFKERLDSAYLREAVRFLCEQGSSWCDETTTVLSVIRKLPTVQDLFNARKLRAQGYCSSSREGREVYQMIEGMISRGEVQTEEYHKQVFYRTSNLTQEYVKYGLYRIELGRAQAHQRKAKERCCFSCLRLKKGKSTVWNYDEQEKTNFDEVYSLTGLMLYGLALGSLEINDQESLIKDNMGRFFFRTEVSI